MGRAMLRPEALASALVLTTACLSARGAPPPAAAPADPPAAARYDAAANIACLAEARAALDRHAAAFAGLARELEAPPSTRACVPMRPDAPFAAFEGRWSGHWNGASVEHVWRTVAPGVQLVLLVDDGVTRRGINLRASTGDLCGIVIEPDGEERRHRGRFVPARGGRAPVLRWSTPDRDYFERVRCLAGAPVYEIRERIFGPRGPRWGTSARYRAPVAAAVLAERAPRAGAPGS